MTHRRTRSTLTALVVVLATVVGGAAVPGVAQQSGPSPMLLADRGTAPLAIAPTVAATRTPAVRLPARAKGPAPLLLVAVGSCLVGLGLLIRRRQSMADTESEPA